MSLATTAGGRRGIDAHGRDVCFRRIRPSALPAVRLFTTPVLAVIALCTRVQGCASLCESFAPLCF